MISEPMFWKNEVSGHLGAAVRAYVRGDLLRKGQITMIRTYLQQWIMAPQLDQNPYGTGAELQGLRDLIPSLNSRAQIEVWMERAMAIGIDPL